MLASFRTSYTIRLLLMLLGVNETVCSSHMMLCTHTVGGIRVCSQAASDIQTSPMVRQRTLPGYLGQAVQSQMPPERHCSAKGGVHAQGTTTAVEGKAVSLSSLPSLPQVMLSLLPAQPVRNCPSLQGGNALGTEKHSQQLRSHGHLL